MNQQRLDDLLDAMCADALTADELAELDALIAEEPDAARQVARICDLTRDLGDHLRPTSQCLPALQAQPGPGAKRAARPSLRRGASRPRRTSPVVALPLALIGAAAAIIAVVVLFTPAAGPERWLEGHAAYANGGRVVPGQLVATGVQVVSTGTATLCFSDGTRVRLADGTRLTLGGGVGKQLHLDSGLLQARVARQSPAAPFQVWTGHTRVTVIGTAFTLAVQGARTELSVAEGAVRLHADGIDTVVTAGQQRVVDPTTPTLAVVGRPALLVPRSAVWAYHDVGEPPEAGWHQTGFDDRAWRRGPAPLGYDRDGERTVFATVIHSEKEARMTNWFRHEFTCDDPAQIRRLELTLQRDDGLVVYLNGREIVRDNLPQGPINAQTPAVTKIRKEKRDEDHFFTIPVEALRKGRNCIAAEVHQDSTGSTDLLFSLELRAGYQPQAEGTP